MTIQRRGVLQCFCPIHCGLPWLTWHPLKVSSLVAWALPFQLDLQWVPSCIVTITKENEQMRQHQTRSPNEATSQWPARAPRPRFTHNHLLTLARRTNILRSHFVATVSAHDSDKLPTTARSVCFCWAICESALFLEPKDKHAVRATLCVQMTNTNAD